MLKNSTSLDWWAFRTKSTASTIKSVLSNELGAIGLNISFEKVVLVIKVINIGMTFILIIVI